MTELIFWLTVGILFCLGLVQVIGYVCQWMLRPKGMHRFYTMIPVSGHMEDAEQVLRWAFSTMRWDYWANANWLLILDMGADGIVVPMVCSLEEAKQAAAATHYPPDGIRGMGTRRAVNYGIWDKNAYVADTDKYILTIVQIEHIDVVKDLPEIAKLPGISGFVVGPNDFTMSMNTPERTYTVNDPEVQEQFDKIGQALAGTGKLFGVSGACSEKFVTDWIRRGVNYMCMNFDFNYIVSGAKNVIQTSHAVLDQLGRAY